MDSILSQSWEEFWNWTEFLFFNFNQSVWIESLQVLLTFNFWLWTLDLDLDCDNNILLKYSWYIDVTLGCWHKKIMVLFSDISTSSDNNFLPGRQISSLFILRFIENYFLRSKQSFKINSLLTDIVSPITRSLIQDHWSEWREKREIIFTSDWLVNWSSQQTVPGYSVNMALRTRIKELGHWLHFIRGTFAMFCSCQVDVILCTEYFNLN